MKITLLCVGKKMPAWVNQGYESYATRMRGDCRLSLIEVPQGKHADPAANRQREGELLLQKVRANDHLVCLDIAGQQRTTEQLSQWLASWKQHHPHVLLAIGGPEGLSQSVRDEARQSWSLSPLTFPHPLVRVIVAEQLYRADSLLKNHPYHRA